jgi:hypothetical protein
MSLLELSFEIVNRTTIEGDRVTTLETGEMVAILVCGTVECFAIGLGANLQESCEFEGIEGSIDRSQAKGLVPLPEFNEYLLGREGVRLRVEQPQNAIVTARALGFHGNRN